MKFTRNCGIKSVAMLLCAFLILNPIVPFASTENAASLQELWVGGAGYIDFNPTVYSYEVQTPLVQDTDGDWSFVRPSINYLLEGSNVDVYITYPTETTAEVTVVENDIPGDTYSISFTPVGANMYTNGGFEAGTTGWTYGSSRVPLTSTENNPGVGTKSLEIDRSSVYAYYKPTASPVLQGGKYYIGSSMIRLGDGVTGEYNTNQAYLNTPQAHARYTPSGEIKGSFKVTSDWQRTYFYAKYDNTQTDFATFYTTWATEKKIAVDDYYISDLLISDVQITDEHNNTSITVDLPDSGTSQLQLNGIALNQFGLNYGLENEAISEWSILGNPTGVEISDTGLLTIDDTAEQGTIYVEGVMTPSFSNATQKKVKGVTEIKLASTAAADLLDVAIMGESIDGFDPKVRNYNVTVPYMHGVNDCPVVTYIKRDSNAEVSVEYPDVIDEGVITVTVTAGEIVKEYTLSLTQIGKNMYQNGGFEEGTKGWTVSSGTGTLITENVGEGEKSMMITGANADRQWYASNQPVLSAGKTYISHNMVRMASKGSTYTANNFFDKFSGIKYDYDQYGQLIDGVSIELNSDWQKRYTVLTSDKNYSVKNYYTKWGSEPDILVDDYYIGELIISSINYEGKQSIIIPEQENSENTIDLKATLRNQFDNQAGLENETILWELAEDYQGISISGNTLVVNGTSYEQEIIVVAKCVPSFSTSQGVITRKISIDVNSKAGDAMKPRADGVKVTGILEKDALLEADYTYYHATQIGPGNTQLQWCWSNSPTGPFYEIEGADSLNYCVESQYVDKYICICVIPETETGIVGEKFYSNVLFKPTAPEAKDVAISGVGTFGGKLTGSYKYYDINNDIESGTSFRWLIGNSEKGPFTPIEKEATKEYIVREEDLNKYVCFEVVPSTTVEPLNGKPFVSEPVLCAAEPTVSDVKIKKVNNDVYTVSYQYNHVLSIPEGISTISWEIDGKSAGSDSSLVIDDKKCVLSVTVTPVASLPPFEGKSVTVTYNVNSGSTLVGQSHSSGGSGGGITVKPTPVIPTPTPSVETIDKTHWAYEAIKFVTDNGIMETEKNGDFRGSEKVSRADFIYYVMKAIGAGETEYANEFADVSSSDYYAGALQKAVQLGIISRDESFYPDREVSREEICKILVIALKYDCECKDKADLSKFKDENKVALWARGYVATAVQNGVLIGISQDEFMPKGVVTREQTAVILKRLYDFKARGEV